MRRNIFVLIILISFFATSCTYLVDQSSREARKQQELDAMQNDFLWWPTDASPAPVKDDEQGGFWWWPKVPGEIRPWGNRGYVYLYKIIYDYKAEEEEQPKEVVTPLQQPELKPSLLIKKIIKNVKIYFDYNKAELRDDHTAILDNAVKTLGHNPEANILITGNCDLRGSVEYNLKLGKKRGETVKQYMLGKGIDESRIKIVSRGKLDAVAPINDLVGMQKERNAQFMIADVEEIMLPDPEAAQTLQAEKLEEGKYVVQAEEKVETEVKVSTKEYTVKKGDSLWNIAKKELGSGHRWKYLYDLNKDLIKDPNHLKAGVKIIIPVE